MSDDRRIGHEARRLIERLDRGGHLERARAVSVWKDVAGPDVAAHATGYAMRGPELVVYTDTAVWASELSALSEQYRKAINSALGREMVGSIRFTVSKPSRRGMDVESEETPAPAIDPGAEPVPLEPAEEAELAEMASAIHDEGLREAALGAAKRHLAWRKGIETAKPPESATGRLSGGRKGLEH